MAYFEQQQNQLEANTQSLALLKQAITVVNCVPS